MGGPGRTIMEERDGCCLLANRTVNHRVPRWADQNSPRRAAAPYPPTPGVVSESRRGSYLVVRAVRLGCEAGKRTGVKTLRSDGGKKGERSRRPRSYTFSVIT